MSDKKMLLWLEDVSKTVEDQIDHAKKQGFVVERVDKLHRFMEVLEANTSQINGIVLDIMLYGVKNLEGLEIRNIDTDRGYEAGWMVLEHYLRAENSRFKNIPVLVFSVRSLKTEKKQLIKRLQKEGATIEFIGKMEKTTWDNDFREWLGRLGR